jgi:hypothetical protein
LRKCLWSDGVGAVMAAAKKAGTQTHTITITNHQVGPRRFDARYAFRDVNGRLLAAGHIERTTRYMGWGFEAQILELLVKNTGAEPENVRTDGEPQKETGPTYPRFSTSDPDEFETEWPSPSDLF